MCVCVCVCVFTHDQTAMKIYVNTINMYRLPLCSTKNIHKHQIVDLSPASREACALLVGDE